MTSRCKCGCGGGPREEGIEIGVAMRTGEVIRLGNHTPGHVYARSTNGEVWVARHPGGFWIPLEESANETEVTH